MYTIETLKAKLQSLIDAGKSGIIALCGDADSIPEDDSFCEGYDALVYVQPLDSVQAYFNWGDQYQTAETALANDSIFKNFAEREDCLAIDDIGMSEKDFLDLCTETLLNDMAHDDEECKELDDEDAVEEYIYPFDCNFNYPPMDFTLTGAPDVASDIKVIKKLLEGGGSFVYINKNGDQTEFYVCAEADDQYEQFVHFLYLEEDGDDDVEGLNDFYYVLLRTLDWRTLYAKSRLFIYQNFSGEVEK